MALLNEFMHVTQEDRAEENIHLGCNLVRKANLMNKYVLKVFMHISAFKLCMLIPLNLHLVLGFIFKHTNLKCPYYCRRGGGVRGAESAPRTFSCT